MPASQLFTVSSSTVQHHDWNQLIKLWSLMDLGFFPGVQWSQACFCCFFGKCLIMPKYLRKIYFSFLLLERIWNGRQCLFQSLFITLVPVAYYRSNLRILTGKMHCQIKLQLLQKVRKWAFGSLLHQINSL